MSVINPDTAARIKACRGVYTLSDTARQFGVSKDSVHRIWQDKAFTGVEAAAETPYVAKARKSAEEIREDAEWILRTGGSIEEAAVRIGVSPNRIRKEVAPALLVY